MDSEDPIEASQHPLLLLTDTDVRGQFLRADETGPFTCVPRRNATRA